MKKYFILVGVVLMLAGGGYFYYQKTQNNPNHYFNELKEELMSYEIGGTLELVDDEALKTVQVQALYKKVEDNDYYYVRLEDEKTHQVQTIVKNGEGVFVFAQGFNRAFQFKTDWPNNGFKPYILQNIMDLYETDYDEQKLRDGYLLTAPITDPTHPNAVQTQILFNQNLAMTQVNLLDDSNNEIIQFKINTYILNPEIDNEMFNINSQEDVEVGVVEDLPLYPLESYDSELIDQLKTSEGHILRYKGDAYFMLVQETLKSSTSLQIESFEGDFYVYEDGLVYCNDDAMVIIKDGIETTIYSNDLSQEEKLNILLSLENTIVIEP